MFTDCTKDLLIEDVDVVFGVGMSVGTVSPSPDHKCVKDVMFRNVNFETPLKAIYIKTNPGDVGTGEVKNITFENIVMTHPIWWGIYIGP